MRTVYFWDINIVYILTSSYILVKIQKKKLVKIQIKRMEGLDPIC